MTRGYRTAVSSNPAVESIVDELQTIREFRQELLTKLAVVPNRGISRAELMRDFGFTRSGIRMLEQAKWLVARGTQGRRQTYDLHEAIRAAAEFPGFAHAPQVRLVRKRERITTVMKQTFWRVVGQPSPRPASSV